jgi:hypothetical protein
LIGTRCTGRRHTSRAPCHSMIEGANGASVTD